MPQSASDSLEESPLRVLLMGIPKVGKSTCTIVSLSKAFGEGYVACCGHKSGMAPAARRTKKFKFDIIRYESDFEAYLKEARDGAKKGVYKWLFVDDFSLFASFLAQNLRDASAAQSKNNEADGRRYWPEFKQRLLNIPRRLFDIPKVHIVFTSHYIEQSPEITDPKNGNSQRRKEGTGVVPMISGAAREELPALFPDVIFMEKENDKRIFRVNPEGVWGPGCRSADGTHTIDADFGAFYKLASDTTRSALK